MRESFPIDYDAEAIYLDGLWLCRDDLAERIRGHLDKGEYRISRLSAALEQLEEDLAQARLLAVRVSPVLAEALDEEASRRGCSSSSLLREALKDFLKSQPLKNGGDSQESVDGKWFEG